jgi:hypothetical protein
MKNAADLAAVIRQYFNSDSYKQLDSSQQDIRADANNDYSWTEVAMIITRIYVDLLAQ